MVNDDGIDAPDSIRAFTHRFPAARLGDEGLPLLMRGHEPDLTAADRILLGELPGRRLVPRPVSLLPYRAQNRYGRDVEMHGFAAVELSNEHLRAVFLPELGGRLWSLVDLATGRDLLFRPDAVQFGNLALRDAWFSGGVEWNLGTTGHWGLTCSPVDAGVVEVDGERILRMWALERLTGLVWRLEAWLPAGSRHLYTSARIVNHHDADVAFYWWSNAAVPLERESRVLTPAAHSFHNDYGGGLVRNRFPLSHGIDGSRPHDAPQSADYFFDAPRDGGAPTWVAGCAGDGVGLMLASTPELPGKKQFVWGNTRGGHRWQAWLNGTGRYFELQSGYTRTQKEHVALAPGAVATWVEAFGPVTVDPGLGWDESVRVAAAQVPVAGLERAGRMFDAAVDVAPTVWQAADGWGRLEVEAGHLAPDPATPFTADLSEVQEAWLSVARGGNPPDLLARHPLVGPRWRSHLEGTERGWVRSLLIGYCDWAAGDRDGAAWHWAESTAIHENAMALHCLALREPDPWSAYNLAERAHEASRGDDDLLLDYLDRARGIPAVVLRVVDRLPERRRSLPRVRLAEARALVATGRLATARAVIDELELPNLRETSEELEDLWREYARASGTDESLPPHLDFAMY